MSPRLLIRKILVPPKTMPSYQQRILNEPLPPDTAGSYPPIEELNPSTASDLRHCNTVIEPKKINQRRRISGTASELRAGARKRKQGNEDDLVAGGINSPELVPLDPRMLEPASKKRRLDPIPKVNPVARMIQRKNLLYGLKKNLPALAVGGGRGENLEPMLNECVPVHALVAAHGKNSVHNFGPYLPQPNGARDREHLARAERPQPQSKAAPSSSQQTFRVQPDEVVDLTGTKDSQNEQELGIDTFTHSKDYIPEWFDKNFGLSSGDDPVVRDIATGIRYPQWYLNVLRKVQDPNFEDENWGDAYYYNRGGHFIHLSDFARSMTDIHKDPDIRVGLEIKASRFPLNSLAKNVWGAKGWHTDEWVDEAYQEKKKADELETRLFELKTQVKPQVFRQGTEYGRPIPKDVEGAFIDPRQITYSSSRQTKITSVYTSKANSLEG